MDRQTNNKAKKGTHQRSLDIRGPTGNDSYDIAPPHSDADTEEDSNGLLH